MKSLAYDIVRTTQQAALAAWPLLGCGDKNQIDGVAVAAMRQQLSGMAMQGQIVIGEGEIDQAPCCISVSGWGAGMVRQWALLLILSKARGWWPWANIMRWP